DAPAVENARVGAERADAAAPGVVTSDGEPGEVSSDTDRDRAEDTGTARDTTAVPSPRPAATTGSSRTVAAAVAQALAARAAAGREAPAEPEPAAVPPREADARDRLLAVLLDDPARAVGAAEELEACRGHLGDVLARLARSGLRHDQLARLSGFSIDEVTALLAQQGVTP
ncbi:hypothetical protein, partial [Pseudonocardia sp.]|uniref:hypothetical protein n=1 Tax=Pseudonocardia sp. TaxID=60912 RepID=UPI0026248AF9